MRSDLEAPDGGSRVCSPHFHRTRDSPCLARPVVGPSTLPLETGESLGGTPSTQESTCFFDGLSHIRPLVEAGTKAFYGARGIDDTSAVDASLSGLFDEIDLLRHLVGAGLSAWVGDSKTATQEIAAFWDCVRDHHGQLDPRVSNASYASTLSVDPRQLTVSQRHHRRQVWAGLQASLWNQTDHVTGRSRATPARGRTVTHDRITRKEERDQSSDWQGLVSWFFLGYYLSAAVENTLMGSRRRATRELRNAQDVADSLAGGEAGEFVDCARSLVRRVSRPPVLSVPRSIAKAALGVTLGAGAGVLGTALAYGVSGGQGGGGHHPTQATRSSSATGDSTNSTRTTGPTTTIPSTTTTTTSTTTSITLPTVEVSSVEGDTYKAACATLSKRRFRVLCG